MFFPSPVTSEWFNSDLVSYVTQGNFGGWADNRIVRIVANGVTYDINCGTEAAATTYRTNLLETLGLAVID